MLATCSQVEAVGPVRQLLSQLADAAESATGLWGAEQPDEWLYGVVPVTVKAMAATPRGKVFPDQGYLPRRCCSVHALWSIFSPA